MVSWAAKWCRDPSLRARLINLLSTSRVLEGTEGSEIHGLLCDILRNIEEDGMEPTNCTDIREQRRIRCHAGALYRKSSLMRQDFLRYPYNGASESVSTSFVPATSMQVENHASAIHSGNEPDLIFGPGYLSARQLDGSYYTLRAPESYFVIPRI